MAGQLRGWGLLVSNDASASRSHALIRNLELAGVKNAVVLNEQPNRLTKYFNAFFDRILVDAPCSGEGMFRRDTDAAKAWNENKPGSCAHMQREILHHAAVMLKYGGRLVYSTCTFNKQENEDIIAEFLRNNPDFDLVPIDHASLGISPGFAPLTGAARIWPHKEAGEGHFLALLEKKGGNGIPFNPMNKMFLPRTAQSAFDSFCKKYLNKPISGKIQLHQHSLYLMPEGLPNLQGLRIARSGWHLGDIFKDRFVPSQALAMGLRLDEAVYAVNLSQTDAVSFVRGNAVMANAGASVESDKPWILIGYAGYPLGWGRRVGGKIKNALPVGWVMR
jgi:NOL1/NOP2/fmu family ribosome biogenesis protein